MNLFYYVTLIALTVLWEAPHQPREGQELVAHTIVNRAQLSGMNIEAVIMQRGQYVGWTPARREVLLRGLVEGQPLQYINPTEQLGLIRTDNGWREATWNDWWQIWWVSLEVLAGKPEPPGYEGVTHFDNLAFWDGNEPPWASEKECLGRVGDHVFYR